MEEISFIIGDGKIKENAFIYMLEDIRYLLKANLKQYKDNINILPLLESDFGKKKDIDKYSLDEMLKKSEDIKEVINSYLIFGNRLKFDNDIGTLDILLTNDIKYLEKKRYDKGVENPLLYEVNRKYLNKDDQLGNIICMPGKDMNEAHYRHLEFGIVKIIDEIFGP